MKKLLKLFNNTKAVAAISLVLAIIAGFFGYSYINSNHNLAEQAQNTDIKGSTEIASSTNITLGFLTSGRIKEVSVKPGNTVKKGQILASLDAGNASGALDQARASYNTALANYQKVINGATGATIDVAKAAVNTAQVNLDQVTSQQEALVVNARRKLYTDGLVAEPDSPETIDNPVITGTYNGTEAGDYFLSFDNSNLFYVRVGGLEHYKATIDKQPQPLGKLGLLIAFPNGTAGRSPRDSWIIHIPNKNNPNYTSDLNAYDLAMQTKDQAIANAQAALDQAKANLNSTVSAARPEDVASAQAQVQNASGSLKIAEAAYQNTVITAPTDGTVMSVAITPGQIASANAPAIDFISSGTSN